MFKKVVIVGGGPAGTAAADVLAASGMAGDVVIVEPGAFGGTCTNRGCIPTKFLLARGEPQGEAGATEARTAWSRAISHKDGLVRGLAKSIERDLTAKGVQVVRGRARLAGPHRLEILDESGSRTPLEAATIILASGSEPAQLPGVAFDGTTILSSTDALALDPVPASMAIIGSGAVGAEFTRIFARQGVSVTLLEAADRLFPAEDPAVDPLFRKIYERMRVSVVTGDPVEKVERPQAGGVRLILRSGRAVEAEKVLVAVGRALSGRALDCDAAQIALGPRGEVIVDDELRTSQPHIFAAGDVNGRMLLAHAATAMGRFAAQRVLGIPSRGVPYRSIPWATFTDPEVAAVGFGVEEARRAGLTFSSASAPMMQSVKARIDRATDGFITLVVQQPEGRLIGATIVGAHASELIHSLAIAIHQGMTITDLCSFVFLHPSVSETIGDIAWQMH